MDEPRGHYTRGKNPAQKVKYCYDLTYTWNLKKLNSKNVRIEPWLPEAGWQEGERQVRGYQHSVIS